MSRLIEYFNEVDKNAVMRAAHQMEPIASMTKFGLSDEEQAELMSGDMQRIAHAAGMEYSVLKAMYVPLDLPVRDQLNS